MKSSEGGGERSRQTDGPFRRWCDGFGSRCRYAVSRPPQLPWAVLPRFFVSSSAAEDGALTQAGDVGPAAWWRHDALGVPTRNVVVNLSTCERMRDGYSKMFTCCKNTKVVFVGKKICSLLVILYGKSVLVSICPTGQLTNPAQNGTNRVLSVSSNQRVVNGPTDQIG